MMQCCAGRYKMKRKDSQELPLMVPKQEALLLKGVFMSTVCMVTGASWLGIAR